MPGSSSPNSNSSNYYNSTGQLIRLVDANGDGVADGPGTVLASVIGAWTAAGGPMPRTSGIPIPGDTAR